MSIEINTIIRKELRVNYQPLSTEEELSMVASAKSGNQVACKALFHSVSGLAVKSIRPYRGTLDIAEHIGDLYLLFLQCVQSFDPCKGYRFSTWFGCKAAYAMKDRIRHFEQIRVRDEGSISKECQTKMDTLTGVVTEVEIPSTSTPWAGENIKQKNPLAALPAKVTFAKVMRLFPNEGVEQKLLAALAGIGRSKPASQADVARELNCSRQNISALFSRISKKVELSLS